jgi:hypothetical protein
MTEQDLLKNVVCIIPHSSEKLPMEIPSKDINWIYKKEIHFEVDIWTDKVYDYTKYLGNRNIINQYSRVFVDPQGHPDNLDDCVPVRNWFDHPLYNEDKTLAWRKSMYNRYHKEFHRVIVANLMMKPASIILDCHSTTYGDREDAGNRFDNDIALASFQTTKYDVNGLTKTCDGALIDIYANFLSKALPKLKVGVNTDYLTKTYGHIEASYGTSDVASTDPIRAPLILQETNENLYTNSDGSYDGKKGGELNKIFAEVMKKTVKKYFNV